MDFSSDLLAAIIIWFIILFSFIGIVLFIVSPKLRIKIKKILPPSTTFFGATHEFQSHPRRVAIEQINEEQAGKKKKEDESGVPE